MGESKTSNEPCSTARIEIEIGVDWVTARIHLNGDKGAATTLRVETLGAWSSGTEAVLCALGGLAAGIREIADQHGIPTRPINYVDVSKPKMEEIDQLRDAANQAILIRREAWADGFTDGKPWDDVEWLEGKILKALREWWAEEPIRAFLDLVGGAGKCGCTKAPCPHDVAGRWARGCMEERDHG